MSTKLPPLASTCMAHHGNTSWHVSDSKAKLWSMEGILDTLLPNSRFVNSPKMAVYKGFFYGCPLSRWGILDVQVIQTIPRDVHTIKYSAIYLGHILNISGTYLRHIWDISGTYLEHILDISGIYPKHI